MLKKKMTIQDQGCGEVKITNSVTQDNTALLMFNKWRRSLPPEQRKLLKDVKIVGFYPVYAPTGMFQQDVSTISMDDDQLEYLIREAPEFRAQDDPLAPKSRMVFTG